MTWQIHVYGTASVELDDWWRSAPARRHAALESLVRSGRIDVMALPFNQTAFLNGIGDFRWRKEFFWTEVSGCS